MKLYIVGPEHRGDGPYFLVAETGEGLASHYCSHIGFAFGDLEGNRPERKKVWKERFGDYEVVDIDSQKEVTREQLLERNHTWFKAHSQEAEEGAKP